MEGSHRGRVHALGKRAYRKVSRVRIPPLPPIFRIRKRQKTVPDTFPFSFLTAFVNFPMAANVIHGNFSAENAVLTKIKSNFYAVFIEIKNS